jgi:peroxin-1
VRLPAPSSGGRSRILASSLAQRGIHLPREQLEAAAARADGYDASDLALLLDRAVHAALARRLAAGPAGAGAGSGGGGGMVEVGPQDLEAAFQGFVPAAFWGVQQPSGEGCGGGGGQRWQLCTGWLLRALPRRRGSGSRAALVAAAWPG